MPSVTNPTRLFQDSLKITLKGLFPKTKHQRTHVPKNLGIDSIIPVNKTSTKNSPIFN